MAALGTILATLGALSRDVLTVALGLAAAVAGVVLYWVFGWFWDWYWDFIERLQSDEIESRATLSAVFLLLFVALMTSAFVVLWWLADLFGVVITGVVAAIPSSVVAVAGGMVPGVALGGGLVALASRLGTQDGDLDVTKGSRDLQLIQVTVLCTLVAYCVLLFVHPPSAVAFAVAYPVSFVAVVAVYLSRNERNPSAA